jgi:type IV secretion system protein VirB9
MRTIIALYACVSLGACAQKQLPPEMEFDAVSFEPAALTVDPPGPVTIVEKLKPLPLPGQLKSAPSQAGKSVREDRPPEERIASANEAAKIEPTKDGYVNAIQMYPYVEGALYQLYTAPEQISDIALQVGERIEAVSAGDTVRWVIGDTLSGSGETARAHVLVKPIKEGLKTNLIILTDRRTYHLELTSDTETYMASVSWRYPQDELLVLQRRNEQAKSAAEHVADRGLRLNQLKFRYALSGDTPPWRPIRVFDDTRKIYIQFPDRLDQGEAPPLFVVGPNGENQLVNYRVNGSYYIVDRLFVAAELRLGSKPQQVVRITRTDGQRSARRGFLGLFAANRGGR